MDIEAMLDSARAERQKRGRSASVDSASSYGSSFASRSSTPDPANSKWLQTLQGNPSGASSSAKVQSEPGVSVDTEIKSDSIGARLLAKMGWKSGQGLGAEGQGRVDPIRAAEQIGFTGLGKTEQEKLMMTGATFKPRELASARQTKETQEQKRAREDANAKKEQVKSQVAETLEKFFCDICNKGYKNVSQWEEHLRSYGHNHAKRKVDLAQQQKAAKANSGEAEKRKERERKREEKEMRKMGISVGLSVKPTVGQSNPNSAASSNTDKPKVSGFKPAGGGFKKVGSSSMTNSSASAGLWSKATGSSNFPSAPGAPPAQPPPPPPAEPSWKPPPPPPEASSSTPTAAPTFKPIAPGAGFRKATNTFTPQMSIPKPHEWKPANAAPVHPLLSGGGGAADSTPPSSGHRAGLGANGRATAASLMDVDEEQDGDHRQGGLVRPSWQAGGSSGGGPKPGFKMAFNRK